MSLAPAHGFSTVGKPRLMCHLIKQVEQVTMLGLEGPPGALPGFGAWKLGDNSDLHISDLAILGLADISLQKTARTARSGQRRSARERAVRQC